MNYFLFWLESTWLVIQTEKSLDDSQEFAKTFDKCATFADSYFWEDVESFDEPYQLVSF